jgi:hypothetical protein
MSDFEDVASGPRLGRKGLDRRIVGAVVVILAALVSISATGCSSGSGDRTSNGSTERQVTDPRSLGIFADVRGWIAYGNNYRDEQGIWAVDPANPGDPGEQIKLSSLEAEPVAWSSDGTKLLLRRWNRTATSPSGYAVSDLIVLNSDGTRTHLDRKTLVTGGSFSPDGSKAIRHLHRRRGGRPTPARPCSQPSPGPAIRPLHPHVAVRAHVLPRRQENRVLRRPGRQQPHALGHER